MGVIKSHRDLRAWKLSFDLAIRAMKATATFPPSQALGLVSQMRRSALSVPSNIAEGFGRGSKRDYIRYLKIARGSLFELDTHMLAAKELRFLTSEGYESLFSDWNEVSRVLAGLISRLSTAHERGDGPKSV
ncbi:MAG: four helix bundle protein [Phycisphaeraceae bacterium]|nr:four helix bundle protein [Phycisphaeraceae bacterium]